MITSVSLPAPRMDTSCVSSTCSTMTRQKPRNKLLYRVVLQYGWPKGLFVLQSFSCIGHWLPIFEQWTFSAADVLCCWFKTSGRSKINRFRIISARSSKSVKGAMSSNEAMRRGRRRQPSASRANNSLLIQSVKVSQSVIFARAGPRRVVLAVWCKCVHGFFV